MLRPVSIRGSLLRNVVVLMLVLAAALMATTILASRRLVRSLSGDLITQTLRRSEDQLRLFFGPVVDKLQLACSWTETGLIDTTHPEEFIELLLPLLRQQNQLSSLLLADEQGREIMLLRADQEWRCRESRREEWDRETRWRAWSDDQPQVRTWNEILDYDPRERPWFLGALGDQQQRESDEAAAPEARAVHWTLPYIFFTTKEPGITVSALCRTGSGAVSIIAFDVLLSTISDFSSSQWVSPNGKLFVLSEDLRVIGLPRDERFQTAEARRAALLNRPDALGLQIADDATAAFGTNEQPEDAPVRFRSGGVWWWGQVRALYIAPDRPLWIAVVVPESDLLVGLSELRWGILLITVAILVVAIQRAAALASRFSAPIEELVAQSNRISRGDLSEGEPVDSNVKEVVQLTRAHERMRTGLQSLMKLERDLQLARQIQQSTFPDQLPRLRGFALDAWSEPAEETGGDTYDVIGFTYELIAGGARSAQHGDLTNGGAADRALVLLADATGHGMGPALSVTQIRAMLRMAVRTGADLTSILRHLNEQLCADLPASRFITAWLGEIDVEGQTLRSFSAGQGPLLHFDASSDSCAVLAADTMPFGIDADMTIEIGEPLPMKPGDIFAVFSDGIFEAIDPEGRQFGSARAVEIIRSHRKAPPGVIMDELRKAVHQFTHGAPPQDDRTAVIIKRDD